MPDLVPVDNDPFAVPTPSAGPSTAPTSPRITAPNLVAVDHDPFAASAPAPPKQPDYTGWDTFSGPSPKVPLQDDPDKTYGNILPFAKDKTTGALSLAVPEFLRAPIRGVVAGGQEALGERPVNDPATRQDITAAAMSLGGIRPGAGEMGGVAPSLTAPFGPKAKLPTRINASDQAKATIGAGFVLPPAEASVGHIGEVNLTNMAAGEAGKIKLGQLAAAKNQPLVNIYSQKELGLPPGTTLSPQAFKAVRTREGQVYQQVASAVPEVDLARDPEFAAAAKDIGGKSEETERLFPSTKEPPGVTSLRAELLAHARGSTQAVMNYIADLRFNATQNFKAEGNAMAHRTGAAQREAANALEDAMERSVQNAPEYYREMRDDAISRRDAAEARLRSPRLRTSGGLDRFQSELDSAKADIEAWQDRLQTANAKNQDNQTLVDRFRQARQTMAKTYDLESVTNVSTGDVSARGLGRLLQQGKPLTGNLKLIADSANSFARAFQDPARFGGVESFSVLDAAAAAGMAAAGHPIAAAIPFTRPFLRNRVLSPRYQRGMILPPQNSSAPWAAFAAPGVLGSDAAPDLSQSNDTPDLSRPGR